MRPADKTGLALEFAVRKADILGAFIVFVGIALRIIGWIDGRYLWLDEAHLAANITDRPWLMLLPPLDFSQSAPVLFLVSVKACVSIFGYSEQAFRLVPLLASVAQLVVFWKLSIKILPPLAGLIAIAFCAFSERLLYFSEELKQYSTETLVTTLLIYLALLWFDQPERKRIKWLFAGFGTVCILFSHTTVFIFCSAIGSALFLPPAKRSRIFTFENFLLFGICWGPLFLINYHWVIVGNYHDEVMINYWANTYPGVPVAVADLAHWAGLLTGLVSYHGLPWRTTLVLIVVGVPGLFGLLWKRNVSLLIVLIPIALYWAAGMAHKAPFFGRLLVFLHPALILAAVVSIVESCRLAADLRLGKIVPIGCGLLSLYGLGKQFTALPKSYDQNLTVDALAQVKRDALPGDVLYVSSFAVSTHRVYAKVTPYPAGIMVIEGRRKIIWQPVPLKPATPLIDRDAFISELKELNPEAKRIWLVLNRFRQLREKIPQDLKTIEGAEASLIWQRADIDLYLVKRSPPETRPVFLNH